MGKLFRHKNGQFFELSEIEAGVARVFPQGGGFSYQIPVEKFYEDCTEVKADQVYHLRPSKVEIDGWECSFDCYLSEQRWNGWRIPYMTRDQVQKLMDYLDSLSDNAECKLEWDCGNVKGADANYPAEPFWISPTDSAIEGQTVALYDMGMGWVWDEAA